MSVLCNHNPLSHTILPFPLQSLFLLPSSLPLLVLFHHPISPYPPSQFPSSYHLPQSSSFPVFSFLNLQTLEIRTRNVHSNSYILTRNKCIFTGITKSHKEKEDMVMSVEQTTRSRGRLRDHNTKVIQATGGCGGGCMALVTIRAGIIMAHFFPSVLLGLFVSSFSARDYKQCEFNMKNKE